MNFTHQRDESSRLWAQKLNQPNDDARSRKHRGNAGRQRRHEFSPIVVTSSAMIDTAAGLPTMPM